MSKYSDGLREEFEEKSQITSDAYKTEPFGKIKRIISGIKKNKGEFPEGNLESVIAASEKFYYDYEGDDSYGEEWEYDDELEDDEDGKLYRYGLIVLLVVFLAAARNSNFLKLFGQGLNFQNTIDISNDLVKSKIDDTPISVSCDLKIKDLKNTQIGNGFGKQGVAPIDNNHIAVAEVNSNGIAYISIYNKSGKLISTKKVDTHNNSIIYDADNHVIISIGGTGKGDSKHKMYEVDPISYQIKSSKTVKNRENGSSIGMDSYGSKDYIVTFGRK